MLKREGNNVLLTGADKGNYIKEHFGQKVEAPKETKTNGFEISFHSLADYNNGRLITERFDLDLIDSYNELQEEIKNWLDKVTEKLNDGETREEYIVCYYENIPSGYVGEYDIDAEFFEYKKIVEDSYYGVEVFEAGLDCGINLADIEEAYNGEYNSDEDFVQELLESCGDIPTNLPHYIHIDWESTARDIMYDYSTSKGHYFRQF